MAETKKSAIARNPVISRVSELDICSVRLKGRAQSASVLEALIETNEHAKNLGKSTFPGFFLSKIFLICFDKI